MMAVAQRFHRRLDDMRRRGEVGLADAKVNDVFAQARKFSCPREHGECVLFSYSFKRFDNLEHRLPRSFTSPYVMFATFTQWITGLIPQALGEHISWH